MSDKNNPQLLILNQMAGPMTWELAEDLGEAMGRVALLTGHPDTLAKGGTGTVDLYEAPVYVRGSFPRRALSWLAYMFKAFFWMWRWPRATPVLLFSNPPILCWLGWIMGILRRQKYAVMVHDIYPDILINLGVISEKNPITRLWYLLNRKAYERAGVVMTLGEYMAANLEKQLDPAKTPAGKVEVIYPWVDTDWIKPIPKEENWFAKKYDQVDKLTVMYSGNMGLGHDIETMLEAAKRLRDHPDIHFMFIGSGPKWSLVTEWVNDAALTNVTTLPLLDEKYLPYSLSTGDLSLVSIEKEISGLAVPSKAIYCMAAGTIQLVITSGESDLKRWVVDNEIGGLIEQGHSESLSAKIALYLNDDEALSTGKRSARTICEERFGRFKNTLVIKQCLSRFVG
jgi:glycosyltransferase involved in cell wall biosynthesis